ncbi:hypothetical protein [Paraburkholderia sediminicola]|uniref:hypothetical protein n=1 Tax=Paraburkholderia sediminicola TaxID=458836 RepID=UPI0038B97B20
MGNGKRMTANELVSVLAGLLNFDAELLARVGNLPLRNLRSWLAGKQDNLRGDSVVTLMSLIGVKLGQQIRLDADRVHYWTITDDMFSRSKAAYKPLTVLSKLMTGCAITAVQPPRAKRFSRVFQQHFMISGAGVRIIVSVNKGLFKQSRVNPETIKGAMWRDDSEDHTITVPRVLWQRLLDRDLTRFEFDQAFEERYEAVTWNDVDLIAREVGVTAGDVARWIIEQHGKASADAPQEEGGMQLDRTPLLTVVRKAA